MFAFKTGLSQKGNRLNLLIGFLMIMYIIVHLRKLVMSLPGSYNSYTYTEFLINFEGGFVRRGLLGQGIYELVSRTGWSPYDIITIFCFMIFSVVAVFMIMKFYRRNLNWWFLLTPFVIGMVAFIIRKDYLTYAITIMVVYLLREINANSWKLILSTILLVFGLFVHEAYFFYGFPIAILLLLSSKSSKAIYIPCMIIVVVSFFVLCVFKGDKNTADAIYESWISMIDNPEYVNTSDNSIGAIGWSGTKTFIKHFTLNFHNRPLGWCGLFFRPLFGLLIYYFVMNFLYVTRYDDQSFTESDRTIFSSLFLFVIVCLLPMFVFLSCDYGRLYQYATITALSAFLIVSHERLQNLFPLWWTSSVERFNKWLNGILIPTKGLMIVLILSIAPAPFFFDVYAAIENSVLYTDIHACFKIVVSVLHLIK